MKYQSSDYGDVDLTSSQAADKLLKAIQNQNSSPTVQIYSDETSPKTRNVFKEQRVSFKDDVDNAVTLKPSHNNSTAVITITRDDPSSEVFSWGCDNSGQLGLGAEHGQGGQKMESGGTTKDFL